LNIAPYPNYRPSGVEWLGNIPKDWTVKRLKWSVEGSFNGVWGDEPDGVDDVVCLRVADFNRDNYTISTEALTLRAIEAKQLESRKLKRGDLLIEKSGGGEKQLVGCVVYFDHKFDAVCSNFVARMPVVEGHLPRYWAYVHAGMYAGKLNYPAIKQTTGIQNLDAALYLDTLAAYPPLVEQQKIATFLDWKTSQIDALIAKKQTLLQKLKEKRLAVITQAVTKGLNPDVPKRDSGSDWIGKVPSHWDVLKIKFVTELASGHTPSRTVEEYWIDCNIPWVSLNDSKMLREKDSISETRYQISELGLANSSARLLPAGVVVFSRDATVGLCAITEVPMAVSQHFVAYICGEKITGKYLLFVLKAMNQHLQSLQTGSTIVTIGMPEVRGLICPLPTTAEQAAIVDHIDSVTAKIDQMLANAETAITRLTEYRSALITAATTGKIDVRAWQPLESSP
jgi:type I restriction enzyme, S subunit